MKFSQQNRLNDIYMPEIQNTYIFEMTVVVITILNSCI